MALTKRKVDSFEYDGRGRDVRWDGEGGLPGFGLRIYPSGKKVFVLVYRRPGQRKQRLKTIGPYGVLTLDGARQRARKLLGKQKRGNPENIGIIRNIKHKNLLISGLPGNALNHTTVGPMSHLAANIAVAM